MCGSNPDIQQKPQAEAAVACSETGGDSETESSKTQGVFPAHELRSRLAATV